MTEEPTAESPIEDDPLMSIGTFSRASLVSIRSLRSYHESGLLVPAEIDPATGYRSYRVSQLADALIVRRLRELDVPLRSIAEVVAARDPHVTRRVVHEHETAMRERLTELERVVDELSRTAEVPSSYTPVHVRSEPARHVAAIRARIPLVDVGDFLGVAYGRLAAAISRAGGEPSGIGGALYAADYPEDIDDVTAFLPVAEPLVFDGAEHDVVNELLPAGTFAVLTHHGSYDTMDVTYRQLGAWVARHARPSPSPIREHYLAAVDPATGSLLPDDDLRTEIAWPVVSDQPFRTQEESP